MSLQCSEWTKQQTTWMVAFFPAARVGEVYGVWSTGGREDGKYTKSEWGEEIQGKRRKRMRGTKRGEPHQVGKMRTSASSSSFSHALPLFLFSSLLYSLPTLSLSLRRRPLITLFNPPPPMP